MEIMENLTELFNLTLKNSCTKYWTQNFKASAKNFFSSYLWRRIKKLSIYSFAALLLFNCLIINSAFAGTETSFSGDSNHRKRTLEGYSPDGIITSIVSKERGDHPCYLRAEFEVLKGNSSYSDSFRECSNGSGNNKSEEYVSLSKGIDGIQICQRDSNHRLKGIKIFNQIEGTSSSFSRNNCSLFGSWKDRVNCPAGQVANKLLIDYDDDDIKGLALNCIEKPRPEVLNIEYDFSDVVLDAPPTFLLDSEEENETCSAQVHQIGVSEEIKDTSYFENVSSTSLEVGQTFVFGIPEIAEVGGSLTVGSARSNTYGVMEEITRGGQVNKIVTTPACSTVYSSVDVRTQTLNVPYEMTLEYDGEIYKEDGIWNGVITWDVDIKTEQRGVNPVCVELCRQLEDT